MVYKIRARSLKAILPEKICEKDDVGGGVVTLGLAAYLIVWPVPIEPVAWHAPGAPGYTGQHAANTRLFGLHDLVLNGEVGPEHVVVGADGKLYTGVESGRILRMGPDGSA
jgi:hypothetical protein